MRPSNINDISARVARGTLFVTAISMLSLHAMAQASDVQKPLPAPLFAVSPTATVAPTDTAQSTATPSVTPGAILNATAVAPSTSAVAQTANRVSGFAAPADTADAPAKTPALSAAATPPVVPVATQANVGATSRANIRRLNQAQAPAPIVQHPLAEAYPGFEVIVCLAGCGPEPKAVSIYKPKPRQDDYARINGGMNGAIMRVSMTNAPEAVECLAGCYDNTPTRSAIIDPSKARAAAPSVGSPVGATDRSVMIQTSTAIPANAGNKPKPKAAKKQGSEWFTRRFERKAS
jgi:hypothetical protein